MTSGVAQSSAGSVTETAVWAAPTAPAASVAVNVTGQMPARLNVCVALVDEAVDESSGNVHFVVSAPPSASVAVPVKLRDPPFATVAVSPCALIETAGGLLVIPVTVSSQPPRPCVAARR